MVEWQMLLFHHKVGSGIYCWASTKGHIYGCGLGLNKLHYAVIDIAVPAGNKKCHV